MKLFKLLLQAQAGIALLAPITAVKANEVNLKDISNYSRKEIDVNIKSFGNYSTINPLLAGGEGMSHDHSGFSSDSFSSTTTMSGSASFTIGSIDNDEVNDPNQTDTITGQYSYNIDLNTSFNGEDNLYVGLIAGNGLDTGLHLESTNISTEDEITVDSIFYSFSLGNWDWAIGPKLDQNDLVATTTTKYSDSFYLGGVYPSNIWTLPGLTGAGFAVAREFDNGFNFGANLISLESHTSDGMLTNEGADVKTIMGGYNSERFGAGLIHTQYDDIFDVGDETAANILNSYGIGNLELATTEIGFYFKPIEKLTANIGTSFVDANIGIDSETFNDYSFSLDYEINENNTISAALVSMYFLNTNGQADYLGDVYELYLTRKLSDSISIRAGVESQNSNYDEGNGTTISNGGTADDWVLFNQTVYALETTFRF